MKKTVKTILLIICLLLALFSMTNCFIFSDEPLVKESKNSYTLDNNYFYPASFTKFTSGDFSQGDDEYSLRIESSCVYPLYEYSATVKLYSKFNSLLSTQTITIEEHVSTNRDFFFYVDVSHGIYNTVSYIDVEFTGKTREKPVDVFNITLYYDEDGKCETFISKEGSSFALFDPPEKKNYVFVGWYKDSSLTEKYNSSKVSKELSLYAKYEYNLFNVTLHYNNGETDKTIEVTKGNTFPTPKDPQRTNYTFLGWYTDSSLTKKYDFSKSVVRDLSLYAKYELDATTITNKISTDTIKGIVKIYSNYYNKNFWGKDVLISSSLGSGFCFHIQDGYYYILTNCHVALIDTACDKHEYIIEDYLGNQYTGYLYKNSNKSTSAISADYDLACLYFKASSSNVKEIPFATDNPKINEDVISLGAPSGQSNAIGYGIVKGYKKVELSNTDPLESNVTFDVMNHNAFTNSGSSGGPILNSNLEVIGVHYAGSKSTEDGYAIPIEKVKNFLSKYVYN